MKAQHRIRWTIIRAIARSRGEMTPEAASEADIAAADAVAKALDGCGYRIIEKSRLYSYISMSGAYGVALKLIACGRPRGQEAAESARRILRMFEGRT